MTVSNKRRLGQVSAGTFSGDKTTYEQRIQAYIDQLGGGIREIAIGNQLDAILKWADNLSAAKAHMEASAIDQSIKDALAPLYEVPADLQQIITVWQEVKAAYPA